MCQEKIKLDLSHVSCDRLNARSFPLMQDFSCGNDYIDTFFHTKAVDSIDHTAHVVWSDKENRAIAAFSLACSSLNLLYGKDTICDSVAAVEITYFAVDKRYQKTMLTEEREDGYISDLIMDKALSLIYDVTENFCAATYVILYATPEAIHFYERNGFRIDEEHFWRKRSYALDGCVFMLREL